MNNAAQKGNVERLADRRERSAPEGTGPGRTRYAEGWREGKPVEDPEKTKSWGFITAKPSEYLVHVRRGRVMARTSGQGGSCFKLPWDSVAIIPTTLSRLQFRADQVTREKVGVEVVGLAVYRITNPELTYKMLNFSFAERAGEKLEETLGEMFVGSVRRLVANMSVEEVLTRRKEGLAAELMREIAPVVQGSGRPEDATERGWGVVIDTIEIQDVRVLSHEVFSNMQALFRSDLERRAREAWIAAEAATRERKAQAESRAAEIEYGEAIKRERIRAAAERVKIEEKESLDQRAIAAQARIASEQRAQEQAARLAEIEREREATLARRAALEAKTELEREETAARNELQRAELAGRIERERTLSEAQSAQREREISLDRLAGETENLVALGRRQVANLVSDEAIRRELVAQTIPAVAAAFAKNFGEMRFTQIGGVEGGDPMSFMAKAFAQVVEVARSAGFLAEKE